MARLTKSVVDRLPVPSTGYALHWDEQDRDFGLRITKDGKKSYVVQGRVHGKELRLTIGPHGVFTVDQAREAAREHLRNMRLGTDPRDLRRQAQASGVNPPAGCGCIQARPPTQGEQQGRDRAACDHNVSAVAQPPNSQHHTGRRDQAIQRNEDWGPAW